MTAAPWLANLLLFTRALRRAGLPLSPDQTMGFVRALDWIDIGQRIQVYHAARSLLVTRREDLAVFDALFYRFFRVPGDPPRRPRSAPPRQQPGGEQAFTVATYMAYKARRFDREVDVVDRSATYSPLESLQSKEFSEMTPEELLAVRQLLRKIRFAASRRKTRRLVPAARGRSVDLTETLRKAARYGAVPLSLPRRSVKVKDRPVVLIADISGSMEKYSRLVLQLFYSMSHSLDDVESFVFATRLTRLTPQLRLRNVDRAIELASRQVIDWGGGTRIGECLSDFNRHWSRRVLHRGALVVVLSDGWERGDAELLGREMRYLHHRSYRLIWLNPLAGRTTYEPRVSGMAAVLPYVDDFLPVHNLESLDQLAEHLRSLPARRTGPSRALSIDRMN